MATIQKRVGKKGKTSYTATIRLTGCGHRTETFSRLTDAKHWVQITEAELREKKQFPSRHLQKYTFKDLAAKYEENKIPLRNKDKETVRSQLHWWSKELDNHKLINITVSILNEKRDKLLRPEGATGKKLAPATVVRYIATLSDCFSYAVKDLEWLESNPVLKVRKPKLPKGRVRYLEKDEVKALLAACSKHNDVYLEKIVRIAISTGARQGEILGLKWKNVDFKKKTLRLIDTKNGESRPLAITSFIEPILKDLYQNRNKGCDLVFPRKDSCEPVYIRKKWTKALKEASIEDFKFHDLRHTAASYLAMNNVSSLGIGKILGHNTPAMVKRYSHLSEPYAASALERMNSDIFEED